jgi:hypothetical protein
MMKRNVLWGSGVGGGIFIFLLFALIYDFCGSYREICKNIYTPTAYLFFSFPLLFLLSLITYKMKEQAFLAWWGFAKWWVWVIIAATFLLNGAPGGGWGINSGVFSFGILFVLYMVLTVVSLWRVGRVWWRGG